MRKKRSSKNARVDFRHVVGKLIVFVIILFISKSLHKQEMYVIIPARSCSELNTGRAPAARGHSQTHTWCQSSRCCLCVQRIKDLFPCREQPFISETRARARTLVHPCVLCNVQPTVPAVGLVCALAQISVTSSYTHLDQSSSEHVGYAAHWITPDSSDCFSLGLGQVLLIEGSLKSQNFWLKTKGFYNKLKRVYFWRINKEVFLLSVQQLS